MEHPSALPHPHPLPASAPHITRFAEDISAQRQVAQAHRDARAQAERATRLRDEMVASGTWRN
jgi:hypothetical protein